MTMGFMVRKKFYNDAVSAVHIDRSARPQMVGKENEKYYNLINRARKKGVKVILNTSFNIHGQPIVCSPRDAIETMLKTRTKHMILGNYYVGL
jgi:carbamoyltransferase